MNRTLAVVVAAGTLFIVGCEHPEARPPRTVVRLTSNSELSKVLMREYGRAFPDVEFRMVEVPHSLGAIEAIQRGEADIGFAGTVAAYFAYAGLLDTAPRPFSGLRGMSVLSVAPIQFVVGKNSGIRHVRDLRGRTLRITGTEHIRDAALLINLVLRAFGIPPNSFSHRPLSMPDALTSLARGTLDAILLSSISAAPSLQAAIEQGARLLPVDGPAVEQLHQEYPFIKLVSIPGGTYPRHMEPVRTVGVNRLLLCRTNLDQQLVYDLTKAFFEALPRLYVKESLFPMEPEEAPAMPIPLHAGAARFYRERELFR